MIAPAPTRYEVRGTKSSVYYRAHSYHTKVPPEAIVPLIEHYTHPGSAVLDPFCGSGMTGVACRLSGRHAQLSDLSPAAVHIATGYSRAADAAGLRAAGDRLLSALHSLERELYTATCSWCRRPARLEYTVWSDVFACPGCRCDVLFWDAGRDLRTGAVARVITCPRCGTHFRKVAAKWQRSEPVQVSVSCAQCARREQRSPTKGEREQALAPRREEISDWYPLNVFESWREMWRGQHAELDIHTAADFFTDRNLRALAAVWCAASGTAQPQRDLLRFAVTGIINRASRRYQWNLKRPTNVLSSTLYVASLNYEFNVFSLLRRKLAAVTALAAALGSAPGSSTVRQCSATRLDHLADNSIDYVFTDPPFGGNIHYADASFLWEAWLDDLTDTRQEAVINTSRRGAHGGKTLEDYEKLMADAFTELGRVLRPDHWASVVFHNSDDLVWSALERALEAANFHVEAAVAFDKSQPSFKGVKQLTNGERVASFDLVLHMRRGGRIRDAMVVPDLEDRIVHILEQHLREAPQRDHATPYIHSFVLRVLLEHRWPVRGFSYRRVEDLLDEHFHWDGAGWQPLCRNSQQ